MSTASYVMAKTSLRGMVGDQTRTVLDGGLATALEARGHDLNNALWSAKLILDNPKEIQRVHLDYFRAGADVAITSSYQISVRGIEQHLQLDRDAAMGMIKQSVDLARAAAEEARVGGIDRPLLVAGSVGPYGAYLANGAEYTGEYGDVTMEELRDFHQGRIEALVLAGADCLACETMPNKREVQVLCSLLQNYDIDAWISCTLRDATHISDGTCLAEVAQLVESCPRVVAVGVNCVALDMVTSALQALRSATSLPFVAYPNSGEQWDGERKIWHGGSASRASLRTDAEQWTSLGAKLVGGCCRMGYAEINIISGGTDAHED